MFVNFNSFDMKIRIQAHVSSAYETNEQYSNFLDQLFTRSRTEKSHPKISN